MSFNIEEKFTSEELIKLKNDIEHLSENRQEEIFKIFKEYNIKYTENNNGIFINLSIINPVCINKLLEYLILIQQQDNDLEKDETIKEEYIKTFFDNNNKDSELLSLNE